MPKNAHMQPDIVGAGYGIPMSKFTFFPLAAVACGWHRAKASEGGILNVDSPAYEHPMLSNVFVP